MSALLSVRNLTRVFGGLTAVNDLSFDIERGEVLGLIGPNGAGKTTTLNLISGFLKPTSGRILLERRDITRLSAGRRAELGVVRTFQANNLFRDMTVLENLMIGDLGLRKEGFWRGSFGLEGHRREMEIRRRAEAILEYAGLSLFRSEHCKNLPHGHQRKMGIAVALTASPRLLLLDEPLTGMIAEETEALLTFIRALRERSAMTIVIIEHNVRAMMSLCDRIVVTNFGRRIAEGPPEEVRSNQQVIDAYLGAAIGE